MIKWTMWRPFLIVYSSSISHNIRPSILTRKVGLLTLPLSSSALICLAGRHHMSCKDIRQRKSGDRQHYKTNKKNNNSKLTPLWKSIFNLFFSIKFQSVQRWNSSVKSILRDTTRGMVFNVKLEWKFKRLCPENISQLPGTLESPLEYL